MSNTTTRITQVLTELGFTLNDPANLPLPDSPCSGWVVFVYRKDDGSVHRSPVHLITWGAQIGQTIAELARDPAYVASVATKWLAATNDRADAMLTLLTQQKRFAEAIPMHD